MRLILTAVVALFFAGASLSACGSERTKAAPSCTDAVRNGTETDIDCGGGHCAPCEDSKICLAGTDCVSATCIDGICRTPACDDHLADGDETDVDCGGRCAPCADQGKCKETHDCQSGVCGEGVCHAPDCADRVKNGTETDIDCGGSCSGCEATKACASATNCLSHVCVEGSCAAPTCADHVKNGDEADVDCGAGCGGCAGGQACGALTDCLSRVCTGGLCHASRSCRAIKSGAPTAADGVYLVDPDGAGPLSPFEVWCDMTTDGGGWTPVSKFSGAPDGNKYSDAAGFNLGALVDPNPAANARLSDDAIYGLLGGDVNALFRARSSRYDTVIKRTDGKLPFDVMRPDDTFECRQVAASDWVPYTISSGGCWDGYSTLNHRVGTWPQPCDYVGRNDPARPCGDGQLFSSTTDEPHTKLQWIDAGFTAAGATPGVWFVRESN